MWAVCPAPYDEDRPIDLRKEAVLLRERARRQEETFHSSHNRWQHHTPLPVRNLYPFMSESYRVKCSLVTSDDSCDDKREPTPENLTRHESRPYEDHRWQDSRGGALETAIRKLHHNRQLQKSTDCSVEERCKSTGLPPEHANNASGLSSKRSQSCPNLALVKPRPTPLKPKSSFIQRLTERRPSQSSPPLSDDQQVTSSTAGGARKRKSFVPVYGDRATSPQISASSPTDDAPPCEDYYSHPEVILRGHAQNHAHAPYLLHVYDYYQQLVQRLRTHPSPTDDDAQGEGPRKRPCRALTGKHVRQGTGASLSTLLTLRQKIQARQRMKEDEVHPELRGMPQKRNKTQKSKPSAKFVLGKIQNC